MTSSKRLRSFVAGATGYVGRAVVTELARREVDVVAHVRPDSPRLATWREHFTREGVAVDETPWERESLKEAIGRWAPTHVFCLVGTTRARGKRDGTSYETVDRDLAEMLLAACRPLAQPPRFVYLSSLGSKPRARGAYLRARWSTEEAVRASGLPYTIARPGVIHGPDRDERRPAEAALAGALGLYARVTGAIGLPGHAARYRPTNAAELAHGLVHAALNYTTIGRVVMAEELRYELANDREYHLPRSRRDGPRH